MDGYTNDEIAARLGVQTRTIERKLRLDLAAKGLRRPVQVMEGNYQRMSGVCPWWDAMKQHSTQ